MRLNYTVGALVRRDFRALLAQMGVAYVEHKGFWDSVFTIKATQAEHVEIHRVCDRANARNGV